MNPMFKVIAVDFDGTLCEDKYPEIGEPNWRVINYIKQEMGLGARVILWTCRCGEYLEEAVEWCKAKGLIFDAVNDNIQGLAAAMGSNSRKVFADEYIDDRASSKFILPYRKEE